MTDNVIDFPAPVSIEPVDGVVMMDAQEAQHTENQIIAVASKLGELLTDMQEREGWKALGFASWTAYLSSGRLNAHRATLYRAMKDFKLSQVATFKDLNPTQRRALDRFPEEHQPSIRKLAETVTAQSGSNLTARVIEEQGDLLMQGLTTGYVDDGDGNPLSLASRDVEQERKARQHDHINENATWKRVVIVGSDPVATAREIADVLSIADYEALARAMVADCLQRIQGERWERERVG